MRHRITDWNDAYANGPNIPGGERWPGLWVEPARHYRDVLMDTGRARLDIAYGPGERNRLDLFLPIGDPVGLVVFVHGGFWLRLDRSYLSHLARGPVEHGYAVAMPSYTLCPDIRISGITAEIGAAISEASAIVGGPIRLIGHSAGGQLATRMISTTSPLAEPVLERIVKTVSLSGLHDLRPLIHTGMNKSLKIDRQEAWRESPALLAPGSPAGSAAASARSSSGRARFWPTSGKGWVPRRITSRSPTNITSPSSMALPIRATRW